MSNTVTVLGGSAASVGVGQGCAGYLARFGETRIVLDLGPGTLQELRKHTDFRALDAVVISHLHVDHMLDVVSMRFSLAYNPVKPEQRTPLWLPPGGHVEPGQLVQHRGERVGSLHARLSRDSLPVEQKAHEVTCLYRLDFGAQALHRVAVNASEQATFAPLQWA